MHERLAARRETIMAGRKEALLDSLEDLACQLEFIGARLDVGMLRQAAKAYRDARQAIIAAQPTEADLVPLFRTLNESTAEMGALLTRYGVNLGIVPPDPGAPQD
jgi:hypothetical protein